MRLYLKIFLIIFLPIIVVTLWIYFLSQHYIVSAAEVEMRSELKSKWHLLSTLDYPQSFDHQTQSRLRKMSEGSSVRISVIMTDGTVLFDSDVTETRISELENHSAREEVDASLHGQEGFSRRTSVTTGIETYYYAKKMADGRVLRVAYPVTYVEELNERFRAHNVGLFVALLVLVGLVAAYVARMFSIPVTRLQEIADDIEMERPVRIPRFHNPELGRVAELMHHIYASMQQQNRKMQQEREKLSHILDVLDEGILLVGRGNVVHLATARLSQLTGGTFVEGENIYATQNAADTIALFKEILGGPVPAQMHKEFRGRVFEIYTRLIGRDMHMAVLHDITERVQYENAKAELVSNVSHELKTPVAMVMGYAETVLKDPEMNADTRAKFLERIYRGADRLNGMINNIIHLLRLESTVQGEMHVNSSTLAEFRQELSMLYESVPEHSIRIHGDDGVVRVDYEHLISLTTNLVDNAIAYSESSEIDVKVMYNRHAGSVQIEVADGGPVIPLAERERIFERFYTISKSRTRAKSGTGLGLSIVKHICRIYRGTVTIRENERGGNTFVVVLVER